MVYIVVISVVALVAVGAYLEHKYGSKVVARVAALEARVSSVEASAKGAVQATVAKL